MVIFGIFGQDRSKSDRQSALLDVFSRFWLFLTWSFLVILVSKWPKMEVDLAEAGRPSLAKTPLRFEIYAQNQKWLQTLNRKGVLANSGTHEGSKIRHF